MSANESLDEYCPSCGNFVRALAEETGWCPDCSQQSGHHYSLRDGTCVRCGGTFTPDGIHIVCSSCRKEAWLIANADAIEEQLKEGVDYLTAIREVKTSIRAICLCCGEVIKGRRADRTYFCREKPACRSAARRLRTLTQNYSHDEALYLVGRELAAHKEYVTLRDEIGKDEALKQLRGSQ